MPGIILGPGNTVILTLSKREEVNEVQTFHLLLHDLSIPTVRPIYLASEVAVSARVLNLKNNIVSQFSK